MVTRACAALDLESSAGRGAFHRAPAAAQGAVEADEAGADVGLHLGELLPGAWRDLTAAEVTALRKVAGR